MKLLLKSLTLCAILALSLQASHLAYAAPAPTPAPVVAPQLPALLVTPAVLGPTGNVTLALPPDWPLSNTRLRVGLFERSRSVLVADAQRDFSLRDGKLQTSLTLQADPGTYEFRLITNDRVRTPLSVPAPFLVPGINREPGWWLLNGTPIQSYPEARPAPVGTTVSTPAAPFFISGLVRDLSKKPKAAPRSIAAVSAWPLEWRTLKLPSLRNMLEDKNSDFTSLRAFLSKQIQEVQAAGGRNYLGFELSTGSEPTPLPANVGDTIKSLRQTLNSVAPGAALILRVDARYRPALAVHDIDDCASLCDAVVVVLPPYYDDRAVWPLKAARRVAEEQPNYDLPIFVTTEWEGSRIELTAQHYSLPTLDYWMNGAIGILNASGDPSPMWSTAVQRNLPLFVGSVTLEDVGVLPTPDELNPNGEATAQLYQSFRAVGRVPLLARAARGAGSKSVESFAVTLGERLSDATIQQFKTAATGGAQIYIEGAPLLDEKGQAAWKLSTLVGATATAAPAKRATMTLEDPWFFGFGRGAQLAVEQSVTVTMNPETGPSKIKPEKGKDVLTGPRVVARLEDGSPAVIITPVGQGEIIWMPHRIITNAPDTAPAFPAVSTAATPLQRYYSAIAGLLQSSLVQVHTADTQQSSVAQQASADALRVAVRRSPKGVLLVAVLNPAGRPAAGAVTVRGVAGVALDLDTESELKVRQRGFEAEVGLSIPAQSWKLLAFATTRKALDDERLARRLTARIR